LPLLVRGSVFASEGVLVRGGVFVRDGTLSIVSSGMDAFVCFRAGELCEDSISFEDTEPNNGRKCGQRFGPQAHKNKKNKRDGHPTPGKS
jgi:hypothetical protein